MGGRDAVGLLWCRSGTRGSRKHKGGSERRALGANNSLKDAETVFANMTALCRKLGRNGRSVRDGRKQKQDSDAAEL